MIAFIRKNIFSSQNWKYSINLIFGSTLTECLKSSVSGQKKLFWFEQTNSYCKVWQCELMSKYKTFKFDFKLILLKVKAGKVNIFIPCIYTLYLYLVFIPSINSWLLSFPLNNKMNLNLGQNFAPLAAFQALFCQAMFQIQRQMPFRQCQILISE